MFAAKKFKISVQCQWEKAAWRFINAFLSLYDAQWESLRWRSSVREMVRIYKVNLRYMRKLKSPKTHLNL